MIALVRAAVERGVTFFDTAEVYGPFTNEELVGEAWSPSGERRDRHQVRLRSRSSTDGRAQQPPRTHPTGGGRLAEAAAGGHHRSPLSAPGRSRCADRRRRRRREGPDRAGQGQAFGLSPKPAPPTIRRAHAVQPVAAIQSEYSLWWREPESEVCRPARSWASASSPIVLWAGASSPARSTRPRPSAATTIAPPCPASRPRLAKANLALVDSAGRDRPREGGDARADRARLAAGAKAMDRPDPRHHQASPPRREYRRSGDRTHPRRSSSHRGRRREDYRAGRPLPQGGGRSHAALGARALGRVEECRFRRLAAFRRWGNPLAQTLQLACRAARRSPAISRPMFGMATGGSAASASLPMGLRRFCRTPTAAMYASGGTELAIFQDAGIWCWDGFRFVYSANAKSLGKPGTPVPFATCKETASQAVHRIAAGEAGEVEVNFAHAEPRNIAAFRRFFGVPP